MSGDIGESRPFLGSWVASTDCKNVTPGSFLNGFEPDGTRERCEIKSGDLRCRTVTRREGTDSPLLHTGQLARGRNSQQGRCAQDVEAWRGRAGTLSETRLKHYMTSDTTLGKALKPAPASRSIFSDGVHRAR